MGTHKIIVKERTHSDHVLGLQRKVTLCQITFSWHSATKTFSFSEMSVSLHLRVTISDWKCYHLALFAWSDGQGIRFAH